MDESFTKIIAEIINFFFASHNFVSIGFANEDTEVMEFVMPLATSDIFGKTFSEDTATKYYAQLSGGLYHMHSMNIYHCDIKEANILYFREEDQVAIGDFGHSIDMERYPEKQPRIGTPYVLSPEALIRSQDGHFSVLVEDGVASDHWSLACVFYQMLTGVRPFESGAQISLGWNQLNEYKNHVERLDPDSEEYEKACEDIEEYNVALKKWVAWAKLPKKERNRDDDPSAHFKLDPRTQMREIEKFWWMEKQHFKSDPTKSDFPSENRFWKTLNNIGVSDDLKSFFRAVFAEENRLRTYDAIMDHHYLSSRYDVELTVELMFPKKIRQVRRTRRNSLNSRDVLRCRHASAESV